jgi:sugar lactone lactonase YvrE
MRKIIIFVAGVGALSAAACVFGTGFGSVVSSFKAPSNWTFGLSYRPGNLYISAYCGRVVWRTTTTGSVISYHPLGGIRNYGVTVGTIKGSTYYWVVDRGTNRVNRYVDNSSSLVGSFPVPGPMPWGLAFIDGDHMYHTNTDPSLLYVLHPITGSVYSSYPLTFYAGDLAYDKAGYLWIACPHVNYKMVCKCTLSGSVLASFSMMSYGYPHGCAFDGEYVWVGTSDLGNGIYTILRVNVLEHPSALPASIGKVKALFR